MTRAGASSSPAGLPRSRLLLVLLAATTLAACGGDDAAPPNTAAGGRERTIRHGLGTTTVPASPQRIAVLDGNAAATALAVGVRPVAVPSDVADFAYLDELTEGIERIDTSAGSPDLEQVAALRPDLIVGLDLSLEEHYGELSQIAPTVAVDRARRRR